MMRLTPYLEAFSNAFSGVVMIYVWMVTFLSSKAHSHKTSGPSDEVFIGSVFDMQ